MSTLNKYGFKGRVDKQGKMLAVKGGLAKKSFQFCSDGICNNANRAYKNAKASVSNLQIFSGQRTLGPSTLLCTHHLNYFGLQGAGGGGGGGGGAPKKF